MRLTAPGGAGSVSVYWPPDQRQPRERTIHVSVGRVYRSRRAASEPRSCVDEPGRITATSSSSSRRRRHSSSRSQSRIQQRSRAFGIPGNSHGSARPEYGQYPRRGSQNVAYQNTIWGTSDRWSIQHATGTPVDSHDFLLAFSSDVGFRRNRCRLSTAVMEVSRL